MFVSQKIRLIPILRGVAGYNRPRFRQPKDASLSPVNLRAGLLHVRACSSFPIPDTNVKDHRTHPGDLRDWAWSSSLLDHGGMDRLCETNADDLP